MFLALTCPLCGTRGQAPCHECLVHLRAPVAAPSPPGIDLDWSLFSYEGRARRLVTGLKYGNNRALIPGLARALADLVSGPPTETFDLVTWVPTTAVRRRQRGFDQSALLARAVAGELALPSRALLAHRPGPAQTGRDLRSRRSGPEMSSLGRSPARVLLVDDVVTSGATASAAAKALRDAGAKVVVLLTIARTPRKRSMDDRASG